MDRPSLRRGRHSPAQRLCREASVQESIGLGRRVLQPFCLLVGQTSFVQTAFGQATWGHFVEPNFPAYEACLSLRNELDRLVPLFFLARISARTCRTVSLRQIVSMGWRAFFRMSTICRGEVSRYKVLPSVSKWYSDVPLTVSARRLPNSRCRKRMTLRTRCRENPRRRNSQITATSARSSMEYNRRRPSRAGTTMWRSSHHCSCRGVMPVNETTSRDVNGCCMFRLKMFQTIQQVNV